MYVEAGRRGHRGWPLKVDEVDQAMIDYQRTGFGGWPWDDDGPR